jgi:hypothetical protein
MGHLFEEAQVAHLESHKQVAKGKQVLDFMWVYVYKFDKHGRRLNKCKAHLVKGDQRLAKSQIDLREYLCFHPCRSTTRKLELS